MNAARPKGLATLPALVATLAILAALTVGGCGQAARDSAGGDAHDHGDGDAHDHGDDDHDHGDGDHDHGEGDHDHGEGDHDHGEGDHDHGDSWTVTAWGEHFEVFAEADRLQAGEFASSHTRVTVLAGFSPLRDGLVEIVLRRIDGAPGGEHRFTEELPRRDGVFDVSVRAPDEGDYELSFRIEGSGRREEIPAGTVRVGTASDPGGLEGSAEADPGGEVIAFPKEQQWRAAFSTTWAQDGEIHRVVRGPGRIGPVAGGETVLAAPMSAVLGGDPWPHVGQEVAAGERLFVLTPQVAADRSLAELVAGETEKRAELRVAEERLARLESLLPSQATSPAEVERARASVIGLRAQHEAARSDLRTARAGRSGGASGESVPVRSPLGGRVAEVSVRPGQVVSAGEALGRVVRVDPFWVEVFLRPAEAARLASGGAGLALRGPGMSEPVSIPPSRVRFVARSPEVSSRSGTVSCIYEVTGSAPILGTAVEAEVTLPETRRGIVVPASTIVDDGGTPVVYVQVNGEGFVRRQVEVLGRQASSVLVRGVRPGERVVDVGGPTIRRATLVASGVGHGHVH